MDYKKLMEAALKAAREIAEKAKNEQRPLTADEVTEFDAKLAEAKGFEAKIKSADESEARFAQLAQIGGMKVDAPTEGDEAKPAKTLGEHFVKSITRGQLADLKTVRGFTVSTPEFKAATDVNVTPAALVPALTEIDRTVVRAFRRPVVSDLLGTGTISGTGVTYFVEGTVEGGFATVAENGQKPQLHFTDPTPVTDSLKKIAGWWDNSDEMIEDLDFWVSEINNRGLYLLSLAEENQVLNGAGTGSTILGLLNRSGIQTVTQAVAPDSAQDAIFRAMTAVQTATGLAPDAVIINPTDYQALRLAKDSNQQYYGGGYFFAPYGNDGLQWQPPIWGLNTVVTAAVPAKTVVVGALKAAATLYRKGGVRVESTNSDQGKFTKDIVTTRIEERAALAVRIPAAVAKVTLL